MPRLISLSLVLLLMACAPWEYRTPNANPSPAFGLPLEDSEPTPIPTPDPETQWLEPDSRNSVLFELPSPVKGQDVYWIRPNGEPPQKLINVPDSVDGVVASPGGTVLAIHTSKPVGINNESLVLLFMRERNGFTIEKNTHITSVVWSPDGKTLIYARWPKDGYMQIVGYDIHASTGKVIADFTSPGIWYVDGWGESDRLLLSHLAGGGKLFDEIALLSVAGGGVELVYSDLDKMLGRVALAPDGRKIVFSRLLEMGSNRSELYLLDLASRDVKLLLPAVTSHGTPISLPVWSPDSAYLAVTMAEPEVVKGKTSSLRLATIKVENGEISVITEVKSPSMLVYPLAWLSDRVLLANNLGGEALDMVLYSLHVDGSGMQKIAPGRFLTTLPEPLILSP